MEIEKRKKFLINFCYVAVALGLIFIIARFLISYLLPFMVASIIAFLMQRPAEYIAQKTYLKKSIIAAIFSLLVYFFVALIAVFLIYRLTLFLGTLTENLPGIFENIGRILNSINSKFSDFIPEDFWNEILNNVTSNVSRFVSTALTGIAKGTPSFLFSSVVALVASCYIAKDYDKLVKFIKDLIGEKFTNNIVKIKSILFESVFKFIKGYVILSVITYLEILIGLMILRVENALLIAFVVALVDILPVLGTGTVLIPWAVIAIIFGNIPLGVGLAVVYVLIVIIRNFLEPKIIGAQMGINPLFTLLAMFIGLRLFGVVGLFSFPVILIVVIKFYKE